MQTIITQTNRKKDTYFLHKGKTKKGNPKYYFSQNKKGELASSIPQGYEVYENPNAQVFLRKIPVKIIFNEESQRAQKGLEKLGCRSLIDVRGKEIIVYTSDGREDLFRGEVDEERLEQYTNYSPMLKFVLENKENRIFQTYRFCFLGSIDDWIEIGGPDELPSLTNQYLKHLGHESFFELL